jgi:hypothetical protein
MKLTQKNLVIAVSSMQAVQKRWLDVREYKLKEVLITDRAPKSTLVDISLAIYLISSSLRAYDAFFALLHNPEALGFLRKSERENRARFEKYLKKAKKLGVKLDEILPETVD